MSSSKIAIDREFEAERATLGAVLINNDLFGPVHAVLRPDDFLRETHRTIWRAIVAVQATNRPIDLVTVREELARVGKLDEANGPAYVAGLANGVPRSTNVQYYATLVRESSLRRRLSFLATTGGNVRDLERSVRDLVSLNGATNPDGTRVDDPSVWMPTPASELDAAANNVPVTVARGLFYENRLTCIHSPKKMGKSTLLGAAVAAITTGADFLDEPTKQGTVLWIGEETADDIAGRHLQFNGDPERLLITDARSAVRYAPGLTPVERLTTMIRASEADVLLLDTLTHLARLLGVRSMSASIEAQELADLLQEFARGGMPVAFTHHQPRAPEGGGYQPRMRDSTAFEAAVDAEIAFKRSGTEVVLTCTGARWNLPTVVADLDRERSSFKLIDVRDPAEETHSFGAEDRDWCADVQRIIGQRPGESWTMSRLKKELRVGGRYEKLRTAVNVMVDAGTLESYQSKVRGKERECFRLGSALASERQPGDEDPDDTLDSPPTDE